MSTAKVNSMSSPLCACGEFKNRLPVKPSSALALYEFKCRECFEREQHRIRQAKVREILAERHRRADKFLETYL